MKVSTTMNRVPSKDTVALASWLEFREQGLRLLPGPWQLLGEDTWGVPVAGCMSLKPIGDVKVQRDGKSWRLWRSGKQLAASVEEMDPLLARRW